MRNVASRFFVLVLTTLVLFTGSSFAADKKANEAVKIKLTVYSKVKVGKDFKTVAYSPTVMTLSGKEAAIAVGGQSTLNDREVKMEGRNPDTRDDQDYYSSIKIMPVVMGDTKPKRIRLSINFLVEHAGKKINRNFRITVIDGESFEFETGDAEQLEETKLNVIATVFSVKGDAQGKAKVKVDVK